MRHDKYSVVAFGWRLSYRGFPVVRGGSGDRLELDAEAKSVLVAVAMADDPFRLEPVAVDADVDAGLDGLINLKPAAHLRDIGNVGGDRLDTRDDQMHRPFP